METCSNSPPYQHPNNRQPQNSTGTSPHHKNVLDALKKQGYSSHSIGLPSTITKYTLHLETFIPLGSTEPTISQYT